MRLRSLTACVPTALVVVATPAAARAQGSESQEAAARRSLLEQAQQARVAGDHARALDLAERAGRISMSPSLRMFIAQEQAALGQTAAAFGSADLCVREADRDATVRNREAILATCREIAASLRMRVARVTVQIPSPAPPGVRVTVAGNVLNDAFFGVPYLVTPGTVVVEAAAEGYRPFRTEVSVAANVTVEVPVTLERLPEAPTVAAGGTDGTGPTGTQGAGTTTTTTTQGGAGAQGTAGATPPVVVAPPSPPPPPSNGAPVLPWIVTGVGAATLGASLVFLILRQGALGTLEMQCDPTMRASCLPDARPNLEAVVTFNALTNVTFFTGAAVTAGGIVWLLLSRGSGARPAERRATIDLAPTAGGAFLSVRGAL